MSSVPARNRLAFALDYPNLDDARRGAVQVVEHAGVLKVGLELFVSEGPAAVKLGSELGADVFLDLKLHDIPETVARAVGTALDHGVRYLTLHASGGPRMLEAAARRAEGSSLQLLAVTVLTSLDQSDLARCGVTATPGAHAATLATMAWECGVTGFVCSVSEVGELRRLLGPSAVLVTPGIRPAGGGGDDQKRTGTPRDAIERGASVLVVGRPIRDAADPAGAARDIVQEIAKAAGG